MIKHEATRPLVFSSNYYQTRQNLLDIESLKVDDLDIHAYRYVMKPTLPIRRDSPKKAITLILAVLLGGMVGAGLCWGVTLCVITTRNNLCSFKETGRVVTPCPFCRMRQQHRIRLPRNSLMPFTQVLNYCR